MQYFFILGRNPELSLAELHAILPQKYTLLTFFREVVIIECEKLDAEMIMRRLGGTIKMGTIAIPPLKIRGGRGSYEEILTLLTTSHSKDKKLFLGLSAYTLDPNIKLPSVRGLRELGIEVKRELQKQDYKVRLVTSKEIALSSVIVKREKLLSQGAEIILFHAHDKILLGKTLAVQEFEDASARDFGRPERSMGIGMLPIQLTKILINLSRAPLTATILDPFCGLGTVLTEATQMGYTNLIGADLEQTMVDATRKNLEWLQKKFTVHRSPFTAKLLTTPVEQLSKHPPPHSVDAIITEPYMGPTRPEAWNMEHGVKTLTALYISAFREFSKILKPGGRVVFIFPVFKSGATLTKTSAVVLPEIKKSGFEPLNLLPRHNIVNRELSTVNSITYSRPDQKVLREIFVLKFKK